MNVATIFPIYILFLPKHPYWSESYCQNRQTASLLVFLWFLKQHGLQTDRALTRCSELIAASTFLGCHGYSDVVKERSPLLPFSHPSTPWRQGWGLVQTPQGLSLRGSSGEIPTFKFALKCPGMGLSVEGAGEAGGRPPSSILFHPDPKWGGPDVQSLPPSMSEVYPLCLPTGYLQKSSTIIHN